MQTKRITPEYCIELYKSYDNPILYQTSCVMIGCLKNMLAYTKKTKYLKTFAIFKIKLKNLNEN